MDASKRTDGSEKNKKKKKTKKKKKKKKNNNPNFRCKWDLHSSGILCSLDWCSSLLTNYRAT